MSTAINPCIVDDIGILYLNFAAYPIIFQTPAPAGHGFSLGIGGLAFLGILVGTVLSVIVSIVSQLTSSV
jgi:hypothetical protein